MKKKDFFNKRGFTIVETMVAAGLFAVVVVLGIGAMLSANSTHARTASSRSIVDGLHFVMEDMTRNLRLGSNYGCANNFGNIEIPRDCSDGHAIMFEGVLGDIENDEDSIVYRIVWPQGQPDRASIQKSQDSGNTFVLITSSDILIDARRSGFTVSGSFVGGAQPRVTINLAGIVTSKGLSSPFQIQTTVSQRQLDSF